MFYIREKKPFTCESCKASDKKHRAKGLCYNCYFKLYFRKRAKEEKAVA